MVMVVLSEGKVKLSSVTGGMIIYYIYFYKLYNFTRIIIKIIVIKIGPTS